MKTKTIVFALYYLAVLIIAPFAAWLLGENE